MNEQEYKAEIHRIVGECAGFVSMCWDPKPTGVFSSTEAADEVNKRVNEILVLIEEIQ